MLVTKREKWKSKYYAITRESGKFVSWHKWKRSDPTTWIGYKKPPKKGLWTKVTLYYEGSPYRSFHIDAGIVRFEADAETLKKELWRMIVKEANRTGWKLDKSYFEKDGIMLNDNWLEWGVGYEEDGSFEEWCEAWRS